MYALELRSCFFVRLLVNKNHWSSFLLILKEGIIDISLNLNINKMS